MKRGIAKFLALACMLAPVRPAGANPVPEREWQEMAALPGRYLRQRDAETRDQLVRVLSKGYLDLYLETPDTLALILGNVETFVPLIVASQTRPFVPNERMQTWFRVVLPGHRAEMVNALRAWLAPGSDSIASTRSLDEDRLRAAAARAGVEPRALLARFECQRLAGGGSVAAQRLADWGALDALPELRTLRRRLGAEAERTGADVKTSLARLDDAITRLEGGVGAAPVTPDGRGSFRSRLRPEQIISAKIYRPHRNPPDLLLDPAVREALWKCALAAREAPFIIGSGPSRLDLEFNDSTSIDVRLGPEWGEISLEQYPGSTQCLRDSALYARVLSLSGEAPPRAVVHGVSSWARFRREDVLVTIDRDSIWVEGRYEFLSDGTGRPFAVRFPVVRTPSAPPLRDWFASIEDPKDGAMVLPRHYAAMDSGFIVFPGAANDTVHVLASSSDMLFGRRQATYLLTTARAWGEPLDRAVLEVDWPDSLGVPRFSLPLVRAGHVRGRTRYRFEAAPFQPDKDLVVHW